ncbi:MAG: Cys-tRNA(Pro) deacylase [Planctomycetes bacterium]|nr:Cys-tRNA(Pro) deacylase [Planctomycetota bacterium]
MKPAKTNAARLLDRQGIPYQLVAYRVDEEDLSAAHLAAQLGEEGQRVYKTLVCRGDRTGHIVCVIPGAAELDLKKAARATGNKGCSLIPQKDLQAVTGYLRGGCSPIGMKKPLPTVLDRSALAWDAIYVSAGVRGLQLRLAPTDLQVVTGATVADVVA